MRVIVIASHGGLAVGALDSARMIMGETAQIVTYSLLPGESATDFAEQLHARIVAEPHNEFVVVSDLYGASVCSSLYPLTAFGNVRLFAGFNLCLLLELLSELDGEPMTDQEADELVELGRKGLREVRLAKTTVITEEDF